MNNAMVSMLAPLDRITAEEFRRITEVTYLGSVWGTMAALRRMRPRNRGVVVQVGSALAYRGIPLQTAYCGAKHALQGFLESVRTELQHEASPVRVVMVQIPAMNTPQFEWMRSRMPRRPRPVAPVYAPELAAEAVLEAAENPQTDLLVGWPTLATLTANTVAPGLVDRYLAATSYEAQQTEEPEPAGALARPDNLFSPVELGVAVAGPFGEETKELAIRVPATRARGALAFTAVAALAGFAALGRLSRNGNG